MASAEFVIDKPAGAPCPNLRPDSRCGIHAELRPRGFAGCAGYGCFGAGQQVTQRSYAGQDWRSAPQLASEIFAMFTVMRGLHELLWYLYLALDLPAAGPLRPDLDRAINETRSITRQSPDVVLGHELAAHRDAVNALLLRASELARADAGRADRVDYRGSRPGGCRPARCRPSVGGPDRRGLPGRRPGRREPRRCHLLHPVQARLGPRRPHWRSD